MRSHHAPPKRLLEQFTYKDKTSRSGRAIVVFERGRPSRSSRDLAGECVERGYFAGATSGESDVDIDKRYNGEYEGPFNRLLPAFTSDLHVFSSAEVRKVAAVYVAHLFRRSVAVREASQKHTNEAIQDLRDIAADEVRLRNYSSMISMKFGRLVPLDEVREALQKHCDHDSSDEGRQSRFVDDLDRGTKHTSSQLELLIWQTLKTTKDNPVYISDTPVISKAIDPELGVHYGVGIGRVFTE